VAFDASISGGLDVAVERSAAPAEVWRVLDRLLAERPGLDRRLAEDPVAAAATVAVLAASRSLQRLLVQSSGALDVLFALDHRTRRADTTVDELVAWKQQELLRIAARDLLGLDRLEVTGAALADLAADVLHGACLLAAAADDAPADETDEVALAVIGMGKLGGRELNYSSDVDVLFVGDGPAPRLERRARLVIDIAKRCYRVDTGLRPLGRDGPLVRSLDSYEAYWDRWAAPWEFQALLRARAVAGDERLGRLFVDTAKRWLWTRPFSADDLRSLRQMKRRAEQDVARRGLSDREIKRGRGGIRDIEFTIQLLQLVHGPGDPELRSPSTLTVLGEMATAGYVDPSDSERLADAFRFLRRLEDRLQLHEEQQVHTVPDDPAELDHLARVLGYRGAPDGDASERFLRDLRLHQLAVRSIHERVYFRPLLEVFSNATTTLSPDAATTRLTAFGFTDAHRTRLAVQELTRGLNRSSRLMQHLLPLLLDWLSDAPDPDLGLLLLRNLLTGSSRRTQLMETFRDSPEAAQRLCTLLGTSRLLGDIVVRNPDLVARLPSSSRLAAPAREELVERAATTVSWRADLAERTNALLRWKERHLLAIAARDVFDESDVATVGRDLSDLAEATLEIALESLDPQVPFAVIALGRFGGAELSYASDLDVIFVCERGGDALDEANRIASGLLRLVGGATPAARIYAVDAQLRPEGKRGALVRSVEGYASYWERYALVWERQAMLRARRVAGDVALGTELVERVSTWIRATGLSDEDAREIRRMKARIERERIPLGEDPQFHLKLGRGSLSDVEFTAQLLQLRHGVEATGTIGALEELAATGALAAVDAQQLIDSYEFCERTRNRWYLVDSRASDALPTDPAQLRWLARSLDLTPTDLREHYRRVTRRARRVTERLFYDQP
jgi:glutamate-ammonia-ligase adenylyltransferase